MVVLVLVVVLLIGVTRISHLLLKVPQRLQTNLSNRRMFCKICALLLRLWPRRLATVMVVVTVAVKVLALIILRCLDHLPTLFLSVMLIINLPVQGITVSLMFLVWKRS